MTTLRTMAFAGALAFTLAACAQTPAVSGSQDHSAHHASGTAPATTAPADHMATMDTHMKVMREMHEKMSRARSAEERSALMGEHMKLMQEGMAMMGGMGRGGMGGMGMGGEGGMVPSGAASAPTDMASRHQVMAKRMEMMQSMMQMMMDRMPTVPASK